MFNVELLYNPSTSKDIPKDLEPESWTDIHTPMFAALLITIVKIGKQPLFTDE